MVHEFLHARVLVTALCLVGFSTVRAQVPQMINYQGRVVVGGTNFTGTGQFAFALVSGSGTTTYWSNDGTSSGGSQPATGVSIPVNAGLYSLALGDTTITNMTAVPYSVFGNADVRLRIWFNDGVHGWQQLTPDQRITAVGYAMMSGSASQSAYASYSVTSGSASVSGSAGYASTSTTANFATTSGSATISGSAAQSGTASQFGSGNNGVTITGSNGLVGANLNGQAFVFEGDSITASPNGAGQTSYAGTLASGSYPGATFFNGHGTSYISAVGSSVIGTGTINGDQIVTARWSGSTTSVYLTSGSASFPVAAQGNNVMSVTGSNIPYGTIGTLSMSGTLLTLSQPTTGGTGGTLTLGANSVLDRFASQDYPHRPAANGGNGGPRAFYFLMAGANALAANQSVAQIIGDLTTTATTAQAAGFTVVLSTILPDIQTDHWSEAEEEVRQTVNEAIRMNQIPCTYVIDSCVALSGNPALFDVNGVHPIGAANQMLADYWNSELLVGCSIYNATPGEVDDDVTFNRNIDFGIGSTLYTPWNVSSSTPSPGTLTISSTGTQSQTLLNFTEPALSTGQTETINFGVNPGSQTQWAYFQYGYNLPAGQWSGTTVNTFSIGIGNAYGGSNLTAYSDGSWSIGVPPSNFTTNSSALYVTGNNAEPALNVTGGNTYSELLLVNSSQNATFNAIADFTDSNNQPGDEVQIAVGNAGSTNNKVYWGMYYSSANNAANAHVWSMYGASNLMGLNGNGHLTLPFTADDGSGALIQVHGAEKVYGSLTVGGTTTHTGPLVLQGTLTLSGTTTPPTCCLKSK